MNVRNAFDLKDLYICKDEKIHNFLYNVKQLNYIKKVIVDGKDVYIYFNSVLLKNALAELG